MGTSTAEGQQPNDPTFSTTATQALKLHAKRQLLSILDTVCAWGDNFLGYKYDEEYIAVQISDSHQSNDIPPLPLVRACTQTTGPGKKRTCTRSLFIRAHFFTRGFCYTKSRWSRRV